VSKIAAKLAVAFPGVWQSLVTLLLRELRKQAKDLIAFAEIGDELGVYVCGWNAEGWKPILAAIEFITLHGTPTEETVKKFLRRKKLLPA